jgi:hypothetical protein
MKQTILDFIKQAEWRSRSDVSLKQAVTVCEADVTLIKQAVAVAKRCWFSFYTSYNRQNRTLSKGILL